MGTDRRYIDTRKHHQLAASDTASLQLNSSSARTPETAMSAKRLFVSLCTLALSIGTACASSAAGTDIYANVLNGPATYVELARANGQMSGSGCKRAECLAIADLVDAFDILFRRDAPNTMVHIQPEPADRIARASRKLDETILAHRDRFSDYCAALTKLAAHYSEYSIGFHAVEIATRLDTADKSIHCADSVMAGFPHTQDSSEMIEQARETCATEKWGACRAIRARP